MARKSLIPGFRFHPTDVELVMYYLKRKLLGKKITVNAVAEVNIYNFDPWDLPDKSALKCGDLDYYFFCPKSKKYSSGSRANRSTETGFWKSTGKDRVVKYKERPVAAIKTLVFHIGHAGRGERTDWVMYEYKMEDEHLAKTGVAQDMYVLCKVFQKSGAGPKNGAHYGAPFNDEEWGDDIASCVDSQVISGLVGASNTMDNTQKGPTTLSMSEPSSSVVTFSSKQPTNTLNDKQKGPAAIKITEPGSSTVTCSSKQPTNTLNDKQKGLAAINITGPSSSAVTFSSKQPTNALNDKQKGPAAINIAEPGSSTVKFSADRPTNTLNNKLKGQAILNITESCSSIVTVSSKQPTNALNDKQKGLAGMELTTCGSSIVTVSSKQPTNALNNKQKGPVEMDTALPQMTHGDVIFFEDLDLPDMDADSTMFYDDGLFFDELDQIVGHAEGEAANAEKVKSTVSNEDGIYDNLVNLIDLDELKETDFKPVGADYTLDKLLSLDELDVDLGGFYVD